MKKIFLILFIFSILITTPCFAEVSSFLTENEVPNAAEFLPLPPKTTDAAFYNDWYRYEWGKTLRNTERGRQAVEDASHSLEYFYKIYSEPFGLTISNENTPEISALLKRLLATTYLCKDKAIKDADRLQAGDRLASKGEWNTFFENKIFSKKIDNKM